MVTLRCTMAWIATLSMHLICLTLIAAAIHQLHHHQHQSSITSLEYSRQSMQTKPHQYHRDLGEMDGTAACADCPSSQGKQCVGRTVTDENCESCSTGQTFWPCNLKKECWCWDTAGLRDPGDEADKNRACSGCGRDADTETCASNQNSLVPVGDEECAKCMEGQSFWPCDDPDLCWCWDTTKPKKPPAPASGLSLSIDIDPNVPTPCELFSSKMFDSIAPNSTFPYTYEGLCKAIDDYNTHHTEKFAAMGTLDHIRHEIAGFLGNTLHESDDFEAGREYLACGDRKEVDGKVYCKPCNNDLYDWVGGSGCSVSMVDQNAPYNSYCQPSFEPPEGCVCDTITQVEEVGPLAGYVEASKVFYGRGAIQLSWNYNYIRASYSLTGESNAFCEDPEVVATNPEFAWGSAIYFWMENQKEGSTCHKEALKGDFGGTLNNINGGLECPAYKGGWHADAIKMRLNRYCHAASQLGLEALSDLGGCKGMIDSYEECLLDGHCPYCEKHYAGIETKNFASINNAEMGAGGSAEAATDNDSAEPEEEPIEEGKEEDDPEEEPDEIPVDETEPPPKQFARTWSPTTARPSKAPVETRTWRPTGEPTVTAAPTEGEEITAVPTPVFSITMAEPLQLDSQSPTPSPIEKFRSESPTTLKPSSSPTLSPTTSEPTTASPSASPTTAEPSYTPTTPQPTMGPCDGESCPGGEMCRSGYGFCGGGPAYCNENAIWSPDCKANSKPPSPPPTLPVTEVPTLSPIEKATPILNGVFSVTPKPTNDETPKPVEAATNQPTEDGVTTNEPTKKPTAPSKASFSKPSGGKKPVGGKPGSKPSSSTTSSSASKPAAQPSPISPDSSSETADVAEKETSTPAPTPAPTRLIILTNPMTNSPTPGPTMKEYSPTDPEATYYCGLDWADANTSCLIPCPSSKSEHCPMNHKCFAFTSCMDPKPEPTFRPTDRPTNPPFTAAPATPAPITPAPTDEATKADGCNGKPCPFAGECRSQYGFCGESFIYCNSVSTWSIENCGLIAFDEAGVEIQCDEYDILKCPEGEQVYRDPTNGCEHFPCPADKEEENAIKASSFNVPGFAPSPSQKFPELPKPTLPHISMGQGKPYSLPTASKPSTGIIDLGKKPSGTSDIAVDDNASNEVEDDGDVGSSGEKEEDDEAEASNQSAYEDNMQFGGFSANEWLVSSGHRNCNAKFRFASWASLFTLLAIAATC